MLRSSIYLAPEGIVHGHTPEERLRLLAERLLVAMEMGYPTYFTGLEEVRRCPSVALYKAPGLTQCKPVVCTYVCKCTIFCRLSFIMS